MIERKQIFVDGKWVAKSQTAGAVEEPDIIAQSLPDIAWTEQVGNTQVRCEPCGVVGAIIAWNAPLRSIISKAGAAMAAGCTVVLKGPEVAPLTSFIFAEIAKMHASPKFKRKLEEAGVEPFLSTPDQFTQMMRAEMVELAKLIKTAHIKMD